MLDFELVMSKKKSGRDEQNILNMEWFESVMKSESKLIF